ncbi:MAG: hypothetical protein JWP37_1216 [Mucilaginibacter sp.]|nr:hypothetical protein [Mucilaginibacter sp.]
MSSKRNFHPGNYRGILMLILFLVCFYYRAGAQNVQVGSKLDKVSIPIGGQTVLHVTAHIPAKSIISFPQLKDSIGKIKIVNGPKPDTAFDKNDPATETITHSYTITSFDTGVYVIPELDFHTKADVFKTGAVSLQVKPVLVDTTKAFYDIKQPFVVSYTFWDWLKDHWILVTIILVSILLVIAIIYYLKNRPKEVIIEKAAPALPADTIALNKLYELRNKKLWQQNEIKPYYIELTDILREYLEMRYRIKTHEQTTGEIFEGLKNKDMPASGRNSLKQLLTLADLVKFAREKPSPAENEQIMEDAINFIRQTKEELQPVGHKEELPE